MSFGNMHQCPASAACMALHRSIVSPVKGTSTFNFPVYDAPSPFGHGSSGILVYFCPWCGEHLADPPELDEAALDNPIRPLRLGRGDYCCERMNEEMSDEDLILVHDKQRELYIRPLFNGPPERMNLGTTGVALNFCPWSADELPGRTRDMFSQVPLPYGTTNPRH